MLSYEPIKEIYAEIIEEYPDLIELAKDKKKRSLKPIVLYQSDLDSLEAEMIKIFGQDSLHTPVVWRQGANSDDENGKVDETMKGRPMSTRWHTCRQ